MDRGGHNGGAWKDATSVKNSGRKNKIWNI